VSRTANDDQSQTDQGWLQARNELFRMIMAGRSFSGGERNCLFLNIGHDRFATLSAVSGMDFPDDGRCIALTDWDRDGDQDLWISNRNAPRLRFLRNDTPARHHFLSLGLVGNGTTTNRDAIGARVEVVLKAVRRTQATDAALAEPVAPEPVPRGLALAEPVPPEAEPVAPEAVAPGTVMIETLRAGEGFLSQSSKWLHFGLGAADSIDRVVVHWPGGAAQTVVGLQVDQRYRIVQDQPDAEAIESVTATELPARDQTVPATTRVARVALATRVPMPPVAYERADGEPANESFATGVPTLVNLWASWCLPCLQELEDLTAHQQGLRDAGIQVLSLSVDRLAAERNADLEASDPYLPDKPVADVIRRLGYSFPWGHIDSAQMNLLQDLHDQFFFQKRPLPLPSSFLIDADGRLAVIYKGPISADQLLSDVQLARHDHEATAAEAACFPGSVIDHPRVKAVARRADLQTRYRVAAWLEETQRFATAQQSFRELAAMDPDWALPPWHLAKLHSNQRRWDIAKGFANRAIELDPFNAGAHNTLGLILSEQHDPVRAEAHLRKAIELAPDLAEAQNNLGTVLASQGKLSEAQECFERAVKLDDRFAEAQTNLGSVHAALNNTMHAIEHYRRAIEINPDYVDAHNNLGTMYARQGNLQRAIEQYRHVLSLDPNHRDARRNLELSQQLLRN
jgi:tetratricopeptide (TPR) repeat protein/thiol-disulfide isomerase/thioredoxin